MSQDNSKEPALTPPILVKHQGNTSMVTLNRPKTMNAMSPEIIKSLALEVEKWNNDPSVKVI